MQTDRRSLLLVAGRGVAALTALALLVSATVFLAGALAPDGVIGSRLFGSEKERAKAVAEQALGQLPLAFEPNQGQTDGAVDFLARGQGYTLFLAPTGRSSRSRGVRPRRAGGSRRPSPPGRSFA